MKQGGPRVWLARAGREVCSWLPMAGFLLPPDRPQGISAIVRVKDEEEWVEAAIRSLDGFADQVVIGDNGSTDRTPAILARLGRELPGLVEVLTLPGADILTLTNALVARTRHRWIIRWDADFVAQTSGPVRISLLRDWLMRLNPRRYYMVYLRMVELAGDLWHQDPACRTRADAHCWTASAHLRYTYDPQGYESPLVPRWYSVRRWETPCFYHLNIKSDERLFLNHVWKQYLCDPRRHEYPDLAAYAEHLCLAEFGHRDVRRAAREWTTTYVKRLVPFDGSRYPEYPALIRPDVARPRYRILYDDGRIVGRQTLNREGVVSHEAGNP